MRRLSLTPGDHAGPDRIRSRWMVGEDGTGLEWQVARSAPRLFGRKPWVLDDVHSLSVEVEVLRRFAELPTVFPERALKDVGELGEASSWPRRRLHGAMGF